jgi:Domain of unknown function (DU1801)
MSELKTKPTAINPEAFIRKVTNEQKRKDSLEVLEMMAKVTREPATMWGTSIIGFGKYHYKYDSGREGDMCLTGFSPRTQALTLYLGPGLQDEKLMASLGKYKTGKGCLYIKKLDDVDRAVLRKLIKKSVEEMRKRYVLKND